MDDRERVAQVLAGNTEKFRGFVEAIQQPLFAFVAQFVPEADREELVQDVFLTAFQQLRRFDSARGSFRTWVFTIARNRCLNHLQRAQRRPLVESSAASTTPPTVPPEGHALRRELHDRLDRSLNELNEPLRTTFVLAEIIGLPHREVAQIEGIEQGTVKSRLHRARSKLRAALEDLVAEP